MKRTISLIGAPTDVGAGARNRTAELAVDLVESLFGKSTLMRR